MSLGQMLRTTGVGVCLCCSVGSWGEELLTVVPGRVPYLGEAVGHVVVTAVPDRPGKSLTLKVTTDTGTVLGAGPVAPGRRSAVEIPLKGLPEGTTVLHCRLLAAGREVATADTHLTRLPPKPHAVQIDNRRRGLVVDGLPFFPFGFYCLPPGPPDGDPGIPPNHVTQGFNWYMTLSSGHNAPGLERIRVWMDRCAEVGVKVTFDLRYDCFVEMPPLQPGEKFYRESGWNYDLNPKGWQALRTLIEGLRDHPALLCWYIADEPPTELPNVLERLAPVRRLVRELDPYHPAYVSIGNLGSQMSSSTMPGWRQITDIAMLDNHHSMKNQSVRQQDNFVTKSAELLARVDRLFAYSVPLWDQPMCYGMPGGAREPSPQELRAMTFAGLISGATAIQYFAYSPDICPRSPRVFAEAGRLAQEAIELTPFLLSEEPRRKVTAGSPAVVTAAWQDRGMALVMALNAENSPTSLQVRLAGSGYSGRADVLFENRQVEVRAGVIEDTIEGLGTRVYQIPEGPFPGDRAATAPGNLRLNPSFEEWVNAGNPTDVWWDVEKGAGSNCFLDARTVVHGRHSLRMTAAGTQGIELTFREVELQPGKQYRVSIWAKAERSGAGLRLALAQTDRAGGEQFALSPEWEEYSVLATARSDVDTRPFERPKPGLHFDGPGTAWVDLFQVVLAD